MQHTCYDSYITNYLVTVSTDLSAQRLHCSDDSCDLCILAHAAIFKISVQLLPQAFGIYQRWSIPLLELALTKWLDREAINLRSLNESQFQQLSHEFARVMMFQMTSSQNNINTHKITI